MGRWLKVECSKPTELRGHNIPPVGFEPTTLRSHSTLPHLIYNENIKSIFYKTI